MISRIIVHNNRYYDSMQLLFITSSLRRITGVDTAYVAMGTAANIEIFRDIGFESESLSQASANDMVVGIRAIDEVVIGDALKMLECLLQTHGRTSSGEIHFTSIEEAVRYNGNANLCLISVPSAFAKNEAIKALKLGLHVLIFSDNVPLEDEREIKQLAASKGLLCMGPDCGVCNINGVAFFTGSIVRKGPIGICAASGAGLQQVSALIHEAGSGISQGIGTGGKDLRDIVGGTTMLAGIDALEKDDETRVIVLISRRPEERTLDKILKRIALCIKPVVVYFIGCEREIIEKAGAIPCSNLEDTARKSLELIGISLPEPDLNRIRSSAEQAAKKMTSEQKYVRGLFCGGTYCEEAMAVMSRAIGPIYSNAPLSPEFKLKQSSRSVKHCVVDYGDEEFTLGHPHPDFDPEQRGLGIVREASDPETAVILLDFIIGPGVHEDPVGAILDKICEARSLVEQRGGYLAVVASVSGTEADPQCRSIQEKKLREAGVHVCMSNYQAALLASEIITQKERLAR